MFEILTSLVETVFKILFELLSMLFGSSDKKGYHAKFVSEGALLSRWNKGFSLTGRKQITEKDSFTNCLVTGSTGSGKTQVTLLSSLFAMRGSFIVSDPSGELFKSSAGYLEQKGYIVKVLHFSNADISSGFNPMSRAKTQSEIQKLAAMLVRAALSGGKTSDPFWETQATTLLGMLIAILKTQPKEYQNLYNVRQLLNLLAEKSDENTTNPVDTLFVRHADPVLYNEYKSFIAYDDKLLTSVIASAKSALTLFANETVARVTAKDTIDFSEFRKQPTVLYLQSSISDMAYFSVLNAIFFEQLTSYLLSRFPEDDEQNIFMLIDEFGSMAKVPVLPAAFANVRKFRAGFMAIVQDFNQIVHAYGKPDAETIRTNCSSKVYFGGGGLEATKELSAILGKTVSETEDGKREIVPLLTNDSIRMLKPNRALLICGSHPPILAHVRPAYKSRRYRAYMAIQPAVLRGDTASSVPILPLGINRYGS